MLGATSANHRRGNGERGGSVSCEVGAGPAGHARIAFWMSSGRALRRDDVQFAQHCASWTRHAREGTDTKQAQAQLYMDFLKRNKRKLSCTWIF